MKILEKNNSRNFKWRTLEFSILSSLLLRRRFFRRPKSKNVYVVLRHFRIWLFNFFLGFYVKVGHFYAGRVGLGLRYKLSMPNSYFHHQIEQWYFSSFFSSFFKFENKKSLETSWLRYIFQVFHVHQCFFQAFFFIFQGEKQVSSLFSYLKNSRSFQAQDSQLEFSYFSRIFKISFLVVQAFCKAGSASRKVSD